MWIRAWILALAVALTPGCSADAPGSAGSGSGFDFSDAGSPGAAKDSSAAADTIGGGPQLPPEQEKDLDFGTPEASSNFVFIPSTDTDQVVKISGATLNVTLVEVGDRPVELEVVPGQDAVVVLHAGADEAVFLRAAETQDEVLTLPALPHSNTLAVDPTGGHAVVWYDHTRGKPGDPVGSFQAVTVLRLQPGKEASLQVSVGFRPRSVQFTPDGQKALVVTDDGVCVLELAKLQPGDIVAPVPVAKNPLDKPAEREVVITPDAVWAVVRASNLTGLRAVHLQTKQIIEIPLSSTPTDLDVAPDGKRALAMLRDSGEAALVELPAQVTTTLVPQVVGLQGLVAGLARITDDGQTALLYTSVAGIEQVSTLDLQTLAVQPVLLRKTVDSVFLPPGSRKALLMHKPAAGPGGTDPVEKLVDDSEGYTLFDLDTGFTKLVLTPVRPTGTTTSTTPLQAWLLLPDPKGLAHAVQRVELASFLTQEVPLGSRPEHVRYLPKAGMVAITQDHPSGRVTFVHAQTLTAKTVTGYELNGLVK